MPRAVHKEAGRPWLICTLSASDRDASQVRTATTHFGKAITVSNEDSGSRRKGHGDTGPIGTRNLGKARHMLMAIGKVGLRKKHGTTVRREDEMDRQGGKAPHNCHVHCL